MATLQSAQEKLGRKAPSMAANFNASKGRAVGRYGTGMSRFLGAPVAANILASYQAGMSAATYRAPDPAYWAQRMREKFSGG